jgi:hypothetical protein
MARMNTAILRLGVVVFLLAGTGCQNTAADDEPPPPSKPADAPKPPAVAKRAPLNKQKTLWLEVLPGGQRRVLLDAAVCLREGPIELLLCRVMTKEHEAILHADVDAQDIHKALIVCGAAAGHPVRYQPKYIPPNGDTIKVSVRYAGRDGKEVTEPARRWVRHVVTRKDLDHDWVFAGSRLFANPDDKDAPPLYGANSGDVVCVSNFETALLDLPIDSSKNNDALAFEAHTERIPAKETKVTVIFETVPAGKR